MVEDAAGLGKHTQEIGEEERERGERGERGGEEEREEEKWRGVGRRREVERGGER